MRTGQKNRANDIKRENSRESPVHIPYIIGWGNYRETKK
jgi:hypothetical protein